MKRHTPFLLFMLLLLLAQPPQLRAQQSNRAALVVDFGNGNVATSCVAFAEPELTGRDLLERAGLALAVAAFGGQTAVCGINNVGCPASDCWCQCQGGDCSRWSYWHGGSDSWEYALVGDELFSVVNGAVEGWRWGMGTQTSADPPPFYRFDEICTVPPTPTPIPVQPSPTSGGQAATTVPTATHTPTMTATPSPSPTATAVVASPTASVTPLPSATFGVTRTPTPEPGAVLVPTLRPTATWPPTITLPPTAVLPTAAVNQQLLTPAPADSVPQVTVVVLPTLPVTAVAPAVTLAAPAAAEAVAVVVPTQPPVSTLAAVARIGAEAERPLASPVPEAAPTLSWVPYAVFGLIALALGLVWRQGRRNSE